MPSVIILCRTLASGYKKGLHKCKPFINYSASLGASSSAGASSAASSATGRSALIERETFCFSSSMPTIFALTTSSTLITSFTFSIFWSAIWLMWIRPSTPGTICANAPKDVVPTTLTSQTSSTAYLDLKMFHGFSSSVL